MMPLKSDMYEARRVKKYVIAGLCVAGACCLVLVALGFALGRWWQ